MMTTHNIHNQQVFYFHLHQQQPGYNCYHLQQLYQKGDRLKLLDVMYTALSKPL
jgi:hypothetical protein